MIQKMTHGNQNVTFISVYDLIAELEIVFCVSLLQYNIYSVGSVKLQIKLGQPNHMSWLL